MLDDEKDDTPIIDPVIVSRPRVSSEDQSALFRTAKNVEIALGDDFMQALHRLDTAFKLPDASIHLSGSLHRWREEVELLFPYRIGKGKTAPRITSAESKELLLKDVVRVETSFSEVPGQRLIRRTRPHLGIRFVSKRGTLVDKQTWNSFCEACDALLKSFQNFSSAIHYLSDFQTTWCTIAVGEIMVTLAEMSVALRTGIEGNDNGHDAKKDTDLRNFIRLRLDVCQKQLLNFQDAIDEYKRNEISRVHSIQKRAFDGLSNVTQVSTFFAAVVASTLQFSLTADSSIPFIIINAFWLSSLVLSIGSALNSFLGMKMRKVVSSTPIDRQPFYITFWIRKSYATLLVMSVFAYSAGLGVFVIKSQHTVVAIVTCAVGVCCAVGIAIVCGNHFREKFSRWRKKRAAAKSSSWSMPRISFPKDEKASLKEVKVHHRDGMSSRETIVIDSEYHPAAAIRQMSMHKAEKEGAPEAGVKDDEKESDEDTDAYISRLKNVGKVVDSGPFDDFKRGKIAHMRCSPSGRWVVVCHEHACIVYDAEDNMKHVTLLADDDKHSAEHAEWALEGSTLLTRTEKELRLWKIPESTSEYFKFNEYLNYEQRYELDDGHCKYIKWLSRRDFLLLTDTGTLYRVDFETGAKEANAFIQPEKEGFQVSQVYPIEVGKTDWIICLATKAADLSESVVKAVGDGVDYFLVLEKTVVENRSEDHIAHEVSNFFAGLYFSRFGNMRFGHVQQNAYVIRHRKILPRNIRNMKLCNDHRYMLVNYDENELGTTAPELWELKFGPGYDLLSKTADGSITALRAPGKVRGNASYQWGEASFAGPAHDVIVCEVDGVITFYRFDRHQGPSSLKLIDPGMTPPDFGEFYHPIFTWGDTVQHPLMVATDLDGAGNLCIWSDAEPSDA